MRTTELARIAAEAEKLRLRMLVRRLVGRVVMAVVALGFVFAALGFAQAAAWYAVRAYLGQGFLFATAIVGGTDLLIAFVLVLIVFRSRPSRGELEALEVRRIAMRGLGSRQSLIELAIEALRFANRSRRSR